MNSIKDPQQQDLYSAETALCAILDSNEPIIRIQKSLITRPVELRFADRDSIQSYVDKVLNLNWVQDIYPHSKTPVRVRVRKGQTKSHYEPNNATIAIPMPVLGQGTRWACREIVVLHEIAHHLTRWYKPSHGPVFAAVLSELVDGVMGPEAGFLLRVTFSEANVMTGSEGAR